MLELDATDCLALADACGWAKRFDMPMDFALVNALQTALQLGALLCYAPGTVIRSDDTPIDLAAVRATWGMPDTAFAHGRVADPDQEAAS